VRVFRYLIFISTLFDNLIPLFSPLVSIRKMHQTLKRVFHPISKHLQGHENSMLYIIFSTTFSVFRNLAKHSLIITPQHISTWERWSVHGITRRVPTYTESLHYFVKLKLYGQHYQSSDLTRSLVFSDFNSDLSRVTHFPTTSQGEQRNWVQGGLILGFLWYLVEIWNLFLMINHLHILQP